MGANSTQALAILLLFLAFTLFAIGAFSFGIIWFVLGAVLLAGAVALSLKAKPWEDLEN